MQTSPTPPDAGPGLLFALNAAAADLQRSIQSEQEVYSAFRRQIAILGLRGGLSLLDESGRSLVFQTVAYPAAVMGILRRFEKQLKLRARGYSIQLERVEVYERVVRGGQAVFVPDTSGISLSAMPLVARGLAGPLLTALGSPPGIFAPLILDGRPRGMLNVVGERLTEGDLPAMQAFANHIAVAIENARLLQSQRAAQAALEIAYSATLEGWVKALDLRDQETEGHTLRVAEGAVRLADRMGIPRESLQDVRRGALLHDIGKMAVPDAILRKAGPLDKAEWAIVHQHPELAYEWLSPIEYLRPALDIPYCHHEHWDGSGYPRGLAGEQIPLAARAFAVVDAWDAMVNDRPYRRALSAEQVSTHIREQSGKSFDPRAVDAFQEMRRAGEWG